MIHSIRTSKVSKVIASYLALQLIITTIQPTKLLALTGGPSQPEFNSFTPIGTSDMVNLSSGDFNYNIPVMDVGGYPLNLAYDSGITMDQEASWVGLGWNLNVGQINRQVRGLPDDFKGDKLLYENNLKDNKTIGTTIYGNTSALAWEPLANLGLDLGLTVQHNNYNGISAVPSLGFGFDIANTVNVGMDFSASAENGANVNPSVGFSQKMASKLYNVGNGLLGNLRVGTPYNSRQGITSLNINTSISKNFNLGKTKSGRDIYTSAATGIGTSISFNDQTFTPTGRTRFNNSSFTGDISLGGTVFGFAVEGGFAGFGSKQSIANKHDYKEAFGYDNTEKANKHAILDFNRENDMVISKNTRVLPVTNYTYDLYSVNGQGSIGQFRPFKSQVGFVFDNYVQDGSSAAAFSAEGEFGVGIHVGANFDYTNSTSITSLWNTNATNYFMPKTNTEVDYENTYFKAVGEAGVDKDRDLFDSSSGQNNLGGEEPIALKITGGKHSRKASNIYHKKESVGNSEIGLTEKLYRKERRQRNQAVLKVTKSEAQHDPFINKNDHLKSHHTNGFKILNDQGSYYIYGEAVVNKVKEETSFATDNSNINRLDGTIKYTHNVDNSVNNNQGIDNYYNNVVTPSYAHSYLLTSVLSKDYEDLTSDGPTDDDLGGYTKFTYKTINSDYDWRVPFEDASYNPGLNTKKRDKKGSYVYGKKEIKYIHKIETKTHIAVFELNDRNDGYGVVDKKGGLDINNKLKQLSKIKLYSKPEYLKYQHELEDDDVSNDPTLDQLSPIKTAHFIYDYSLCSGSNGIINNDKINSSLDANEEANQGGKLTLKKVYFTYRKSNMGEFTPYIFHYDNINPEYNVKAYDIWGNYKPLFESTVTAIDTDSDEITDDYSIDTSGINTSSDVFMPQTAQEFPYVQQKDKELQDLYASAWTLSSIDLPSGGKIELEYETDDYAYVQDKKAMQMFKVVGVSKDGTQSTFNSNKLYNNINDQTKYVVVELPEEDYGINSATFESKYLSQNLNSPIYFKFLLNMEKNASDQYDYVTGYFNIDGESKTFQLNDKFCAAIPLEFVDLENNGNGGGNKVNPIAKAGIFFARKYLNRYAMGIGDDNPGSTSFIEFMVSLGSSLATFSEFLIGPNKRLMNQRQIAKKFIKEKSFIRLESPKNKLGGGLRVKTLKMFDNWDQMTNNGYKMFYGQEYDYDYEDGQSSGVASYEPNSNAENPLIEPFYNEADKNIAPKESNYVEKPFGQSFFPSPAVTYSKVKVKNLSRELSTTSGDITLKKHATGYVVNEFYTTKDFPTIVKYTNIDNPNNYDLPKPFSNSTLGAVLGLRAQTHLTLSQGFSIITNDMNGKSKSQKVYDETNNLISGVEYIYSVDENGNLNNNVNTINDAGNINNNQLIGVDYDVINDLRENYNYTSIKGVNANVDIIPLFNPIVPFIIIPILLPKVNNIENIARTAVTTKVVHKTGILKKKLAYDLGASVETENLVWDQNTGQVLLTKTINEYNDSYYNYTMPAYWAYEGMGQATQNLGAEIWLERTPPSQFNDYFSFKLAHNNVPYPNFQDVNTSIISEGDELLITAKETVNGQTIESNFPNKLWVLRNLGGKIDLIDRKGMYYDICNTEVDRIRVKIVRSKYKNLQSASMASITTQNNPIEDDDKILKDDFDFSTQFNPATSPKIVNASAIEYKNFWLNTGESVSRYPRIPIPNFDVPIASYDASGYRLHYFPHVVRVNPFTHNIKGEWRAYKSYAYLTSRVSNSKPRDDGFFKDFSSYYFRDFSDPENFTWFRDPSKWTFASEVSLYSPTGEELENKDALNRRSSAQYGYGNSLPVAVASNSKYNHMGYNGFEYDNSSRMISNNHFYHYSTHENVLITNEEAHTGRKSLKVPSGTEANIALVENNKLTKETDLELFNCPDIQPGDCFTETMTIDCNNDDLGTAQFFELGIPYTAAVFSGSFEGSGNAPANQLVSISIDPINDGQDTKVTVTKINDCYSNQVSDPLNDFNNDYGPLLVIQANYTISIDYNDPLISDCDSTLIITFTYE